MGRVLRNRAGLLAVATLAMPAVLATCTDGLSGGETVRVNGVVTLDGSPAVGWPVELTRPEATFQTFFDDAVTDSNGAYELVTFGVNECLAIAVEVSPPASLAGTVDPPRFEQRLTCGDNQVDVAFTTIP